MAASTTDRVGEHFARALAALGELSGDVRAAGQLLAILGWDLPPGAKDIGLAQLDVARVAARLDTLNELRSEEGTSDAELAVAVAGVVAALADALDDMEHLAASFQASPAYLQASGIVSDFFPRLAEVLVIQVVGSVAPKLVPIGSLLGVFEFNPLPANPAIFQVAHVRQVVRWDRLSRLFTDPTHVLTDVYGWGTADFRGNALVTNIGRVVEMLAADIRLRPLPRAAEEQLAGRPVPEADTQPGAQLFASLAKGLGVGSFDVGLSLYPLRASTAGGTDGGLGLSPYAFGTTDASFELSDSLSLGLAASAHLQGGLALLLRAGHDPQLRTGLITPAASGSPPPSFALSLRHAAVGGGRQTLLSAPSLVIDAAALSAGLGITAGADLDPSLTAAIEDGQIRLLPGEGDGFLASILPKDGITTQLDLKLAWSHRGGLRIEGGVGMRTTLELHRQVGPLRLDRLHLALDAGAEAIAGSVSVDGAASIGPVTATVTALGAAVALRFKRGNLGPVDLGVSFKPPTGIGLEVDAGGVVTGGGFLFHDPAQHVYAGALQLSLGEALTLKAFGLIATRMPDGSPGYSLVVFITAEDFRPIQLGMGFTLLGIGGMVAIHRTFSVEAMREGLKNNALGNLLFPKDPVRNAPAIIRSLAAIFPARSGSYLLGVLAKIGWGTPTLVTLDLALILEFGKQRRLIVLGRISALLPTPDNDLIRLKLDAMGVLDFDQGTASIDAVLVDSRLAHKFVLTGDMALRARWHSGPGAGFVLAVGGFNPRFAPPTGLPTLARVSIALASGNNPRLTCEAYFAITANTLQFGARAELYAEAYGFSVQGDIGFDVLLQLAPFHFLADFRASVQLKRGSRNLFKVSVAGELEGPRPLRVSGKASFEILWCDFSVRFDKTLIEGEKPPLPPAVDVLAELQRALAAPQSWHTQRAPNRQHGIALRKLAPGALLVLDPLGQLVVRQQVVPLNTARDIDIFGGAPVAGARRFRIGASLGASGQTVAPVRDPFAPAQFFAMSDDEKLASPSFEEMDAGLAFGSDAVLFDAQGTVAAPLVYESIVIDDANPSPRPDAPPPPRVFYALALRRLAQQSRSGAVALAPIRNAGAARFRDEAPAQGATLREPGWAIVALGADAGAGAPPATAATWTTQRAAVATLNRAGALWQLVPAYELAS